MPCYQVTVYGLQIQNLMPVVSMIALRKTFDTYKEVYDYLVRVLLESKDQGRDFTALIVVMNGCDHIISMDKLLKEDSFQ